MSSKLKTLEKPIVSSKLQSGLRAYYPYISEVISTTDFQNYQKINMDLQKKSERKTEEYNLL